MSRLMVIGGAALCAAALSACATVEPTPVAVVAPVPAVVRPASAAVQPVLKRRIAVGRFSNSTSYGRSLLSPGEADPIADQAGDMLANALVGSGQFLVFERNDLDWVVAEQALSGVGSDGLVGVDALVIGSVTQLGRRTEGQSGFLSSTRKQAVNATVEIRLVDVRTGQVFFTTSGSGEASTEAGEVAGFGSRAGYDSTLNDRAIAAAIADCMTNVIQQLQQRRWFTDILRAEGQTVYVSGGPAQGLKMGDRFNVEQAGETVISAQTGLPITLPGAVVAGIELTAFFGDAPETQGAVARVISGAVPSETRGLRVVEARP
ncbi:CsgG/HfaB family protein [Brevundimonas naejangsanensis]|nr:CsgG/HfaB family protein [Brevundimonas naejangsanensis]